VEKSQEQELEIEERIIVQLILTQLVGLSVYDKQLLEKQLACKKELALGLFTKENIRKYLQVYLYTTQLQHYYHNHEQQELSKVIHMLFSFFPKESQHVNEYFDLLCKLVEQNTNDSQLLIHIQFVVDKLVSHQSNDKKLKQDKILVGELRLLEKLLN
jgi:hypothetical protein